MPIPDFVVALRERMGTGLLWLSGVTAVVRNERGQVLLVRRADNGQWALVSGILEPGEQPAAGLRREIEEETGVVARIEALAGVWTLPELTYPNGDRAQYLDLTFLATHVSGEARVNDDESLEVGWFALDALPPMMERSRVRLDRALAFGGRAWFDPGAGARVAGGDTLATLRDDAGREVLLRRARDADVAAVVRLLAHDQLGATREDPGDLTAYLRAFATIDRDPAQLLVVAEAEGVVVGTLQLTFIPGLARAGALRAQVEAVRVAAGQQGHRLGEQMMVWAVDEARRRGCALVQLTSDKSREGAHRFYERLGFVASHEGFKLAL